MRYLATMAVLASLLLAGTAMAQGSGGGSGGGAGGGSSGGASSGGAAGSGSSGGTSSGGATGTTGGMGSGSPGVTPGTTSPGSVPNAQTAPLPPATQGSSGASPSTTGATGPGIGGSNMRRPTDPSQIQPNAQDEQMNRRDRDINQRLKRGICTGC